MRGATNVIVLHAATTTQPYPPSGGTSSISAAGGAALTVISMLLGSARRDSFDSSISTGRWDRVVVLILQKGETRLYSRVAFLCMFLMTHLGHQNADDFASAFNLAYNLNYAYMQERSAPGGAV